MHLYVCNTVFVSQPIWQSNYALKLKEMSSQMHCLQNKSKMFLVFYFIDIFDIVSI